MIVYETAGDSNLEGLTGILVGIRVGIVSMFVVQDREATFLHGGNNSTTSETIIAMSNRSNFGVDGNAFACRCSVLSCVGFGRAEGADKRASSQGISTAT